MTQHIAWDYYVHLISDNGTADALESALSEVGARGWELVQVLPGQHYYVAIFKRAQLPA